MDLLIENYSLNPKLILVISEMSGVTQIDDRVKISCLKLLEYS